MARKTLSKRIDNDYSSLFQAMIKKINSVKYICTTADIWSSSRRSYMGIAAHWINSDFERGGGAIACRCFKGSHTYDKITELINQVHNEYVDKSKTKIMKTVTDNGANFVRAFAESSKNAMIAGELANIEQDKAKEIEDGDNCDEDEDEMSFIPISDILESRNSEKVFESDLPDHQRRASHTLNLLPTTDSKKCLGTKYLQYKKLHHSAFKKFPAIWNLTSKSPKQAEIYFETTGKHPTSTCPTSWNTTFDCLEDCLDDAILATITHPHFKIKWAPKSKRVVLNQLLFQEMHSSCIENKASSISAGIIDQDKEEIHTD